MILAFSAVALLLTLTPGADTALVLRTAVTAGRRAGILCTLGICLGTMTWAAASALGVAALVDASPLAYDLLRYGGAAYLLWLGWQALVGRRDAADQEGLSRQGFRTGLLTNLLNPKIGVFYATLLPQFVGPADPVLATSLLLAGIHATMGLVWLSLLSAVADRAAALLRGDTWRRRLERATGVALVGFGTKLLLIR